MMRRIALLAVVLAIAATAEGEDPNTPDPEPYRSPGIAFQHLDKTKTVTYVGVAANATQITELGVLYNTYNAKKKRGIPTKPGTRLVFEIPKPYNASRSIDRIWLLHRKPKEDSAAMKSIMEVKGGGDKPSYFWDKHPVWHAVRCRDAKTKKWHTWTGPRFSTLYAEPRDVYDPKRDDRRYAEPRSQKDGPLYDHVDDVAVFMGERAYDLVMVENVSPKHYIGAHGQIHGIKVEYRPWKKLNASQEHLHIFTPSTVFSEYPSRPLPNFGGGREVTPSVIAQRKFVYPKAKLLTPKSTKVDRIADWLAVKYGGLVIRLRSGMPFAQCEVALGNTFLMTGVHTDRDGFVGARQNTKVYASLRVAGQANATQLTLRDWQVDGATILRLSAAPNFVVPPSKWTLGGAFIRMDVLGAEAHVMGVRCQYYVSPPPKLDYQIVKGGLYATKVPKGKKPAKGKVPTQKKGGNVVEAVTQLSAAATKQTSPPPKEKTTVSMQQTKSAPVVNASTPGQSPQQNTSVIQNISTPSNQKKEDAKKAKEQKEKAPSVQTQTNNATNTSIATNTTRTPAQSVQAVHPAPTVLPPTSPVAAQRTYRPSPNVVQARLNRVLQQNPKRKATTKKQEKKPKGTFF